MPLTDALRCTWFSRLLAWKPKFEHVRLPSIFPAHQGQRLFKVERGRQSGGTSANESVAKALQKLEEEARQNDVQQQRPRGR